jgi:hypothetical protein
MVVCTYVYVSIKLLTMKFLLKNIALTLLLALSLFMLNISQPALAADIEAGAKLFKANCTLLPPQWWQQRTAGENLETRSATSK